MIRIIEGVLHELKACLTGLKRSFDSARVLNTNLVAQSQFQQYISQQFIIQKIQITMTQSQTDLQSTHNTGSITSSLMGNTIRQRLNNSKHFTEVSRISDAIIHYTCLEKQDEDRRAQIKGISGVSKEVLEAVTTFGKQQNTRQNFFQRLQQNILTRAYMMNHVLLQNQEIPTTIYLVYIALHFVQVLFFVFTKVQIVNEFIPPGISMLPSSNQTQQLSTTQNLFQPSTTTITLDNYFNWMVFPVLALAKNSSTMFLTIYFVIIFAFYIFTCLCFTAAPTLFSMTKNGGLKDANKFMVRIAALVMLAFVSIMQLPLFVAIFQGFLCNENLNDQYVLYTMCGTTENYLTIGISTVTLVAYLSFLIVERLLYTSSSFDSTLPWASIDRKFYLLKLALKLSMTMSFIFDKSSATKGYISLFCSALGGMVVYLRVTKAVIFNKVVFNVQLYIETIIMWMFLCIGIQIVTVSETTLSLLALYVILGSLIWLLMMILAKSLVLKQQSISNPQQKSITPTALELYFYYIYQLIESDDQRDQIAMFGLFLAHIQNCKEDSCKCDLIAQKMGGIAHFRKRQEELKKEANDEAQTQQSLALDHGASLSQESKRGLQRQESRIVESGNEKAQDSSLNQVIKRNHARAMEEAKMKTSELQKFGSVQNLEENSKIPRAPNAKNSTPNLLSSKLVPSQKRISFKPNPSESASRKNMTNSFALIDESLIIEGASQPLKITNSKGKNIDLVYEEIKTEAQTPANSRLKPVIWGKEVDSEMNEIILESLLQNFDQKPKKVRKLWFKFLAILIQNAVDSNPKSVELKILNSFIQRVKLQNEYKAIFELLDCVRYDCALSERFTIFSRLVNIEQQLIINNEKNAQLQGNLDVKQVLEYDQLYHKYCLIEYVSSNSALCFWRELMQKDINASSMQKSGTDITRNYTKIQEIAEKLFEINPSEIKFIHRYGLFLRNIVNNEYDALMNFEKAIEIYTGRLSRKMTVLPVNEQTILGENTACGFMVIAATSTEIGEIIHANEEIFHLTGFIPKDLIGKNINSIQPKPVSIVHDRILRRYVESNKPQIMNVQVHIFGCTSLGYLKHMNYLVKIYPQINGRITFCCFIQELVKYDWMQEPKAEFIQMNDHFIMTDIEGNITNVSEGINREMGLNQKFFSQVGSFQHVNPINISQLSLELGEKDIQEALEGEGLVVDFDTREILQFVELEKLSSEEVLDVRAKLGIYPVYIQMKKWNHALGICKFNIYRVIILDPQTDYNNLQKQSSLSMKMTVQDGEMDEFNQQSESQRQDEDLLDLQSVSSASNAPSQFQQMLKDFKKAIGQRQSPKNLVYLNWALVVIVSISILISGLNYYYEVTHATVLGLWGTTTVLCESRGIMLYQTGALIRSFIDIANGIEDNFYYGDKISQINRFEYLRGLIQTQANTLQRIHTQISQQRTDQKFFQPSVQSEFEFQTIPIFLLDKTNQVYEDDTPYRLALNSYLEAILGLNQTTMANMSLPDYLLLMGTPPQLDPNLQNETVIFPETNSFQKSLDYLLFNGLRKIRELTQASSDNFEGNFVENIMLNTFYIIMVTGNLISAIFIATVLFQIFITERNKGEILSLYALLKLSVIKQVYDRCDMYLDMIVQVEGPIAEQLKLDRQEENQVLHQVASITKMSLMRSLDAPSNQQIEGQSQAANRQLQQQQEDDLLSEEEKEDNALRYYKEQRNKVNKRRVQRKSNAQKKDAYFLGRERYGTLIKHCMMQIKEMQSKSDQLQEKYDNASHKNQSSLDAPRDRSISDDHEDDSRGSRVVIGKQKKRNKRKKAVQISQSQQEISEDNISEQSSNANSDKGNSKKKGKNEESEVKLDSILTMKKDDLEHRKTLFLKSIKQKSWRFIILNILLGVVFVAYYCWGYNYIQDRANSQNDFIIYAPSFYDRYSRIIKAYAFIRERMINNGSLDSFYSPGVDASPPDIDQWCILASIDAEVSNQQLKSAAPSCVQSLVAFTVLADSESMCSQIVGQFQYSAIQQTQATKVQLSQLQLMKQQAYQDLISTVIASHNAVRNNDQVALQRLYTQGVDLNKGDYDSIATLHVATIVGNYAIVQWLVQNAQVNLNSLDRWGATPLNYVQQGSYVYTFLKSKGAILGVAQPKFTQRSPSVTDDQYKLFYSAYYGNVEMLQTLQILGWDVNSQDNNGRTALGIAASEGQLDAVKFLVSYGADISIRDGRGDDPLQDATRGNQQSTIDYLNSIIDAELIKGTCTTFENGLLAKGMQTAIGIFEKRFQDLFIMVQQSTSYDQMLRLMKVPANSSQANAGNSTGGIVDSTFHLFISTQELYLNLIIDNLFGVMQQAIVDWIASYKNLVQLVFLVFLFYQFFIIFYLRRVLLYVLSEDVFQSRGILNLIPESFFEENKEAVEKLIKQLKD